ncbi:MAG: hypothetical protein QF741_02030 [Candidatus Peribacteraceae bacterium]|jgi:hypothetical protein|nr:hypothetical protein [Candidatus Peribacteraceae bacterium]|tara:strand:- start:405 stop:1310 length:906 start_codon:yes stop_codon:yes gene_type:complete
MELWCVTPFFAPFESDVRYKNFEIFAQRMLDAGVNLLTVELLYPWTKRRLPHIGKIVPMETSDVLWHKESMINHGFSLLPESCDIAMYMDSDLIFKDADWVEKLKDLAREYDVIQCFQTCHHLPRGSTSTSTPPLISIDSFSYKASTLHNERQKQLLLKRAPGGSWAYVAPYFREDPLYDRTPFGMCDRITADYIHGINNSSLLEKLTPAHQEDIRQWTQKRAPVVRSTFLHTDVLHLWHGALVNRKYSNTLEILQEHGFDPKQDLQKRNGIYQWSSQKPDLHRATLQHYQQVEASTKILV